jgi:hypothetical protein
MTVGLVLYAAPLAMWALFLGMLLTSSQGGPPRRRRIALILVSIWMTFTAARLWHEPAIEPLWLQYLLLIALPGALGFGLSLLARRFGRTRDAQPPQGPATEERPR